MSKCCDSKTSSKENLLAHQASNAGNTSEEKTSGCCPSDKQRIDWILWGCGGLTLLLYVMSWMPVALPGWLSTMTMTSQEMVHAMWWGVFLGAFFVGILNKIPQGVLLRVLGKGGSTQGVLRATLAGVLLDLCNHGILMIAMQLYRKGASLGQVMAFLIASPWNSLTLTLILVGLIGLPLTLLFVVLSAAIAIASGLIFERLVAKKVLPENPESLTNAEPMSIRAAFKLIQPKRDLHPGALLKLGWTGLKESTMVIRWVVFGVVLIAAIRAFVPEDAFSTWFGPSFFGLLATLLVATVLEVCSEGASPIAADLVNRAGAPGNGFVFLMAGAATDYTEVMALKDTTKSWKIALFLPLVTVPQVVLIGWLLNIST